jgi:YebC/PmpR family DNA-binding regulatory protein
MAGHSAWKNIKHRKAAVDAKRGKAWSKVARAIIVAAKAAGGDPATNLSLRYAIDDARAVNMPRDTIEKAIKKGTGELQGNNYEACIYEGYAPHGVALLIEALTDNRNRTSADVKVILDKNGGNLGSTGCVSFVFDHRGEFVLPAQDVSEDDLVSVALEHGALDVQQRAGHWVVLCEVPEFHRLKTALEGAGFPIESGTLTMIPTTTVSCSAQEAKAVLHLIEALEDHDDVQKVHANLEISDAELAKMS